MEEIQVIVIDNQETVSLYIDTGSASGVDSVNGQTGVVNLQTDDIPEVSNLYYTEARVSANVDVAANTLKTGITPTQSSDITTNNAKVGITPTQASDITTNNSKISYTDAAAVALNTAKVGITPTQASDITTNNAKVGITPTQSSNITTNNAKVGVTNEEENTINTELEAGMSGEDLVLNVLSLTSAEYAAGTPVSTTFYIITDA